MLGPLKEAEDESDIIVVVGQSGNGFAGAATLPRLSGSPGSPSPPSPPGSPGSTSPVMPALSPSATPALSSSGNDFSHPLS